MMSDSFDQSRNTSILLSEHKKSHLLIKKVIYVQQPWRKTIKEQVGYFWETRRIKFSDVSDNILIGQRGSLWWNAVTFDMSKLQSKLIITLNEQTGNVECFLDVNTVLQQITPMNKMYFVKEMSAFENYLKTGDEEKEKWTTFQKEYQKDSIRWVRQIIIVMLSAFMAKVGIEALFSLIFGNK